MAGIPNIESNPLWPGQSVPDQTDWNNIASGFSVTGLISGCVVTALASPQMIVAVSAGSVACSGVITAIAAASVTVPAADEFDRRDIIIGMPSGAASIVTGPQCTTSGWSLTTYPGYPPVKPPIPSNCVFLAEIYVASSTTSIIAGNILLSPTALLVTSQYVTSFNNRGGAVTLAQSDIDATFTTAGQLPVGTGNGSGEYLAVGSVGTVLTSQGASVVPQWLPPTGSGAASAGVSTYNTRFGTVTSQASDIESTFGYAGQMYVGTGAGTGELLNSGSVRTVLTGYGASVLPQWNAVATVVESGFTAAGQLYVGTASVTGELLSAGSVGTVLASNGAASVPSWTPILPVIEQSFTAKGQLLVGTGPATGELLTPGTNGYVLTSQGSASIPSWQANAAGTFPLSTPIGGTLGSPYSVTGTTTVFLVTASVAVGTWLVSFSANVEIAPVTPGTCDVLIAQDSATCTFLGPTSNSIGSNPGSTAGIYTLSFTTLAVVTVAGTLAFEAKGSGATIEASTPTEGFANATGYTATRVA